MYNNIVKGNVTGLTQEKVNKPARHKTSLIKLTKKVPIKEKIKILVQKGGGFLPLFFSDKNYYTLARYPAKCRGRHGYSLP